MATYDIGLFIGHGFGDPGACANAYKENDIARMIVDKVKGYIGNKMLLHIAENNYLKNYTNDNVYNLKYTVTVHLNSGGGTGAEAYVPNGEKIFDTEINILKGLEALGLKNRGVKSREYNSGVTFIRKNGVALNGLDYYKENRQSWPKTSSTILEVGFIDNKADLDLILKKMDDVAFVIAKELCKIKNIVLEKEPQKAPVITNDAKNIYRIVSDENKIGAFGVVENITKAVENEVKKGSKVITITKV